MMRETTLHIRVTDDEKRKAQAYAKSHKKSISEIIRALITEGMATGKQGDEITAELQAIRRELSAQGNNLNQIAKRLNSGEQNANISSELKEINRLRSHLTKLVASMRGRLK